MLKSIPKYQNYYYTSKGQKKLYGLPADGVTPQIDIIDQDGEPLNITDFFVKLDNLYFTVKSIDSSDSENPVEVTTFFKQDKDGNITSPSTLPEKPVLQRSALINDEFTIKETPVKYDDKNCQDVDNITIAGGFERFFEVNGFSYFAEVGIYINVSDGRYNDKVMVRENGLYFWPVDSKRLVKVNLPEGEIW